MTYKVFVHALMSLLVTAATGFSGFTQPKAGLNTIIIDPGHGGVDPGARGQLNTEAKIALAISLKLGKALEEELPNIKVIFTRTKDELAGGGTDVNESLRYRARMANENKGDLFISIHCNAAGLKAGGWYAKRRNGYKTVKRKGKSVRVANYESDYVKNQQHGTETFIWAADRGVFKSESINQAQDESGEKVDDSTNILDLNSPEAMIRAQLYEKKYFAKSLMLASLVEEEFVKKGRVSRGVKQRNEKGIWVLQATGMPSVLIETGFVSHTEEEKYINSDKGQQEIVASILAAIKRYKTALEDSKSTVGLPATGNQNR